MKALINNNSKKKILVLIGAYKTIPPFNKNYSGIVDLIYKPIELLPNENIKVISIWEQGLEKLNYDKNRYLHIKICNNFVFSLIPYRIKKRFFGHGDNKRSEYYFKMLWHIWKFKPDTIISHVDPNLAQFAACAYPKAEQIFYYHGSIIDNIFTESAWNNFSSKVNKLVVICDAARKSIEKKFDPVKISMRVIMNGIEKSTRSDDLFFFERRQAREHFGLQETNVLVIYAGRLVKTKGVHELIKGFITAYEEDHSLRLFIAGDPSKETFGDMQYYSTLRELASLLPQDVIKFVGWLSRSEMELLYLAGDISTLLSTKEGGEGNSLFLMESMAHGLACIATNVGGISEVLDQAGVLISPDRVLIDLPETLLELTSQSYRNRIGNLAKNRANYFSYERVAKELIDFVYQPPNNYANNN